MGSGVGSDHVSSWKPGAGLHWAGASGELLCCTEVHFLVQMEFLCVLTPNSCWPDKRRGGIQARCSEYQVPILGVTWSAELEKTLHTHLLCLLWCFLCVSGVIYSSFLAPASFWDGEEHLQELVMATSKKALLSVRWKSLASCVPL